MTVERKYHSDRDDLTREAGFAVGHSIVESSDQPVLLFLSGGSALNLLPYIQQILEKSERDLSYLTIGMVDERFDITNSNFVTLKRDHSEFYVGMSKVGVLFVDTSPVGYQDQYEIAEWYEKKLLTFNSHRVITILGMGPDGHIAGILPYFEEEQQQFYETFLDTERFVVGYDATGKNKYTKRFTLTFPALMKADQIFVFVAGEEKKPALELALIGSPPLHRCPAYFLINSAQKIQLFTDIQIKNS